MRTCADISVSLEPRRRAHDQIDRPRGQPSTTLRTDEQHPQDHRS